MNEKERAAKNLEVIRGLMERATVYRMISGKTALFAGVVSLLVSLGLLASKGRWGDFPEGRWYGALILVILFNTLIVVRRSRLEGKQVFSPMLKLSLKAISPPLLFGALIGGYAMNANLPELGFFFWASCYGLALMATSAFAPKSIWWLGIAFFLSGTVGLLLWMQKSIPVLDLDHLMATSFGVYHVLYGLWVLFIEKDRS